MEYRESFDIILRDSRFNWSGEHVRRLLPNIESMLPPLSAIRFADQEVPRFVWGFPVFSSRRLISALHSFISEEAFRCLSNPLYQENLRALTPQELKEEPYFKTVSELLSRALTESPALRLDSIFWIYLADMIARRLNQEEAAFRQWQELFPTEAERFRTLDLELARLRYKDQRRFCDIRLKLLRSLFARNDFANSTMQEIFDEIPNNPLNREMIANRLIYTERAEQLYRGFDLAEAFLIKGYRLSITDFMALQATFRLVISGILQRVSQNRPLPLDVYFVRTFVSDELKSKAAHLPSQGVGFQERPLTPQEQAEAEEREKLSWLLSLHEQATGYLFLHLADADKDYFRTVEKQGTVPKEIVKAIRQRPAALQLEPLYNEVVRDVLRWDFFAALRGRVRMVQKLDQQLVMEGRPLDSSVVVVNFDSFYEVYRRSRYGTAVFFDLIGFTDRTKALTRELKEAAARGEKERYSLLAVSLSIQRIFSIRSRLQSFGGIPQGFEGDAILDVFPRALDALRYVAAFSDNYYKNRLIRYRPFERPVDNPYQEGFRVGLGTGEYSLISIVSRTNELVAQKAQERAVGHSINRASRLNSGKKGDAWQLTEAQDDDAVVDTPDPFGIYRVRISKKHELNNNGIASFEETFLEVVEQVKQQPLPWYEPPSRQGGLIAGRVPLMRNYGPEFIFEDPRTHNIFLIRRLERRPELKGLEDEQLTVYEYVMMDTAAFISLLDRDATHEPAPRPEVPALKVLKQNLPSPSQAESTGLKSSYQWQDTIDEDFAHVGAEHGVSVAELSRGKEAVTSALERHHRMASQVVQKPVGRELSAGRSDPHVSRLSLQQSQPGQLESLSGDDAGPELRPTLSVLEAFGRPSRSAAASFAAAPESPPKSLDNRWRSLMGAPVAPAEPETRADTSARAESSSFAAELLRGVRPASPSPAKPEPTPAAVPSPSRPSAPVVETFSSRVAPEPTPAAVVSPARPATPTAPAAVAPARKTPREAALSPAASHTAPWETSEVMELEAEDADMALSQLQSALAEWGGEQETHELILELAGEVYARNGTGGISLGRLVQSSEVRLPNGLTLRATLQGYVYGILPARRPDSPHHLVTGFWAPTALEDVRIYPVETLSREPWHLESVFQRYLEDLILAEFRPASARWPRREAASAGLVPLPFEFLERVYLRLKANART
ncbi:MAG: hypothetical protein ACKO6N_27045 [Myxococcota bacterium]